MKNPFKVPDNKLQKYCHAYSWVFFIMAVGTIILQSMRPHPLLDKVGLICVVIAVQFSTTSVIIKRIERLCR